MRINYNKTLLLALSLAFLLVLTQAKGDKGREVDNKNRTTRNETAEHNHTEGNGTALNCTNGTGDNSTRHNHSNDGNETHNQRDNKTEKN